MESWRNRKTLILSRTDMMGLLTPAEYVNCVEQAYRMHGDGRYDWPDEIHRVSSASGLQITHMLRLEHLQVASVPSAM